MIRECIPVNEGWKFCLDPENIGIRQGWQITGLEQNKNRLGSITGNKAVKTVMLPHTFQVDSESEEYRGVYWYEYPFSIPIEWTNKRVWFDFHGIYRDAQFWVNGQSVGSHNGAGFTSFKLDVTDFIKCGANKLIVRGTNEHSPHALPWDRQFDWADDGGIFRPVYLNVCEKDGIRAVRIHQNVILDQTKNERVHQAPVQIEAEIFHWKNANELDNSDESDESDEVKKSGAQFDSDKAETTAPFVWKYELYEGTPDSRGNVVCTGEAPFDSKFFFTVQEATLWHFDRPQLYTLCLHQIRIADGQELDCVESTVGFRSLIVHDGQFVLNGENVQLVGTEWMPGSDQRIGNAETKEDIARWLTILKGCNCIFTRVHWQQDDSFFDWCDRNGMLVQEEVPLWGQPKEPVTHEEILAKAQIDEMLEAHFNHPSIIAWGVGNELDGQSAITAQYVKNMKAYILEQDPNRLMSYVSNTLWETPQDATALGDMIMANDYIGTWHGNKDTKAEITRFWDAHRDTPMVISEFGLCEPAFAGGDPRREQIFLEKMKIYRELGVNGIIWFCLNDYRTQMGEEGEGRLRRRVHGSTDLYGNPKPSYETVKRECAPLYISSITAINTADDRKKNNSDAEKMNRSQSGVEIVIANRNALPCYEADGYYLVGFDRSGSIISNTRLASLKPGETQKIFLADAQSRLARIAIQRPNGVESISYFI